MEVRKIGLLLGAMALTGPASAAEMTVDQARTFVVGKTFAYSCFDGSRGNGRINGDGSVQGSVQMQGKGMMRNAVLPANTVRVKGDRVCASVKGVFFEPCFNLVQTSERSFRCAISGFGFAYCDFTQHGGGRKRAIMRRASRTDGNPLSLRSTLAQ
jgi:hypothetical protein